MCEQWWAVVPRDLPNWETGDWYHPPLKETSTANESWTWHSELPKKRPGHQDFQSNPIEERGVAWKIAVQDG
jgi:hypothetical protein